jgi:hypothetical protein
MSINIPNLLICIVVFFILGAAGGVVAGPDHAYIGAFSGGAIGGVLMSRLGFRIFE